MEEANISQALGIEDGPVSEPEQEEVAQEETEAPQYSEVEQAARDQGWRPKEEWSGDPDGWKSADHFVEWGDMRQTIKQLRDSTKSQQKQFDERLTNVNKFHQAQLEQQKVSLQTDFDDAVVSGDTAKARIIADQQASVNNDLQQYAQPEKPRYDDNLVAQWESQNPWIDEVGPKAAFAQATFQEQLRNGKSTAEGLQAVDSEMAAHFASQPAVNPARNAPAAVASSAAPVRQARERSLTMSDVTSQEKAMKSMFGNEKDFLKAVADSRK